MQRVRTEDDLIDLRHGAQVLAVLAAWARRGYLKQLDASGPVPITTLDGDHRALEITARILAHAGLIEGDGERWGLSSVARRMLAAGELDVAPLSDFFDDWSRLDTVLARGGPMHTREGVSKVTSGGVRQDRPEASRTFMMQLYRRSEASAAATVRWSRDRLPARARILDVGGGHGRYARTFADAGYECTVVDRSVCIDLARELHGDRLHYRVGDFMADDLGGPYDAVFLSNIVHGCSHAENVALLTRLRAVTSPDGLAIVKDMFIDEHGRDPQNATLFGLTMLLYTAGGQSYTGRELEGMFSSAGWARPDMVAVDEFVLAFARMAG